MGNKSGCLHREAIRLSAGLLETGEAAVVVEAGHLGYPTGDEPVVLPVDGPDFGGFVCDATVVKGELRKVGQLRPGGRVRFVRAEDWLRRLENAVERGTRERGGSVTLWTANPNVVPVESPTNAKAWKEVLVREGEVLQPGRTVAILKTMKMEVNVEFNPSLAGATVVKV